MICTLRLSSARGVQVISRVAVWFVGGVGLTLGMVLTAMAMGLPGVRLSFWWTGGIAFIGIELVVHLALRLRGQPSFYDGRG